MTKRSEYADGDLVREAAAEDVRHFNPYRTAKHDAAKDLVRDIAADLRAHESRQRAPKPRDQEKFPRVDRGPHL